MAGFTLETDPKVVLEAFRPLLIPVYEALEIAVPKASQVISENGWASSGYLTSHLVRAEVKRFLHDRKCPIEIDDIPRTLAMEEVAMEGLATKFDGVSVKVFKGSEIPKAATEPRKAFYQHANPGLWVSDTVPPIRSLIVLWDCSDIGTNLRLHLCCTKDKLGQDYWMVSVPHPASWMVPAPAPTPKRDDLEDLLENETEKKSQKN